jgi:hypothetical protein
MKQFLLALFLLCPFISSAQKHYLYADVGLSLAYGDPGFSATYNYKLAKHIGIGAGIQGYVFHPATTNPRQFTPAVYADARFLIRPAHVSQYFITWDMGWNFYKHNDGYAREGDYVYQVPQDNGFCLGLGFGYLRHITRRAWPCYATLKMISNTYKENRYTLTGTELKSINSTGSTLVLSLGFRFGDEQKKTSDKRKPSTP